MNPLLDALAGPTGLKVALALLHFAWQGVLIAAVAAVLMHVVGRRSPQRRYVIGVAGIALMAVAPVVTICLVTPPEAPSIEPVPLADTGDLLLDLQQFDALLTTLDAPLNETPVIAPPAVRLSWPERLRLIQPYAVLLWLGGALLCGLRLVVGAQASVRCRRGRRSLPDEWLATVATAAERIGIRSPRVFVSDRIAEAIAVGLLRPMVLLPAAWIGRIPPEVLEAVLAHELAHLRRHDLWVNLFQRVVESLLFYHPAVWWLSRRIRIEREYCCDETAAAAVTGRAAYARALEYVATERVAGGRTELFQAALAAGMRGEDSMALLNRVRRVLGVEDRPPFRPRLSEGLLVLAVPAALWAGIATVGPALAQEETKEPAEATIPTVEVEDALRDDVLTDLASGEPADDAEREMDLPFRAGTRRIAVGPGVYAEEAADAMEAAADAAASRASLHDALRELREEMKSLRQEIEELRKPGGNDSASVDDRTPSEVTGKDGKKYRAVTETIESKDGKTIHFKRYVPVNVKPGDAADDGFNPVAPPAKHTTEYELQAEPGPDGKPVYKPVTRIRKQASPPPVKTERIVKLRIDGKEVPVVVEEADPSGDGPKEIHLRVLKEEPGARVAPQSADDPPGATGGLSTRADGPSAHDTGGKPPVPPDALPTPESFGGDEFINKDGIRYRSKMEPHHTKDGKTIFIKRFGPVPDDFKPGERKAEDSTDKPDVTFHSRIVHGNRFAMYRIGPDGDLLEVEIRQIGLPKSEEDVKAIVQILESLFGEKRPVWAKSSQWKKIDDDRVELEIKLWNSSMPTFLLSEHDGRLRLKPIRRFFLSDGSQPFIPDGRPPQSSDATEQDQFRLARALGKPVRLSFHDTPLRHVAQTLRNITEVDFLLDEPGLAEEGLTADTPVTIELHDVTALSALTMILKPLNLGYTTDKNIIEITSIRKTKGPLVVETYVVADLVRPELPILDVLSAEDRHRTMEFSPEIKQQLATRIDMLIDVITGTIEPGSWEKVGGWGAIRQSEATQSLVVRQTRDVHEQIHNLLAQLRSARRGDYGPLRSDINRTHFTPKPPEPATPKPPASPPTPPGVETSRDAEIDALKAEIESLKRRLQDEASDDLR